VRDTLICTVGTSLFSNIKFAKDHEVIQQAFQGKNWQQLALLLLEKPNNDRLCGAEINSITSICNGNYLSSRYRLLFLVSETEDGKNTGEVLKLYYKNSRNSLKFDDVDVQVLEGLRDDKVKDFKQKGLKNLVRYISSEVKKFSPQKIAINATGGYKAQISFAGMVGQALEIPVYYLFEKFSEVIELPPQPIALDLAFWLNNYQFFEQMEANSMMPKSEVAAAVQNPYLQSLVDEEIVDGASWVSLSAMGELFHQRSRLQFAKQETTIMSLIPQDDTPPSQKKINLRDDHGKDVLKAFGDKICRSPYVKSVINSLPFNPKQIQPILGAYDNGIVEFVLTWTDRGLGLCIQTTGRNLAETNSIALHLEQEFGQRT